MAATFIGAGRRSEPEGSARVTKFDCCCCLAHNRKLHSKPAAPQPTGRGLTWRQCVYDSNLQVSFVTASSSQQPQNVRQNGAEMRTLAKCNESSRSRQTTNRRWAQRAPAAPAAVAVAVELVGSRSRSIRRPTRMLVQTAVVARSVFAHRSPRASSQPVCVMCSLAPRKRESNEKESRDIQRSHTSA